MPQRRTPGGQQRRTPSGQRPGAAGSGRGGRTERGPARTGGTRGPGADPVRGAAAGRDAQPTISVRTGADASRSATRPAAARRGAAAGATRRTTPPVPGRLTGRATALGLVLLALMLAYAYPVRLYLDQQAEIQRLELQQAAQRATIGRLQSESAKWNDPAYIKAQARARFQMVEPGEKAYIVLPDPNATGTGGPGGSGDHTWYGQLWGALRTADQPGDG